MTGETAGYRCLGKSDCPNTFFENPENPDNRVAPGVAAYIRMNCTNLGKAIEDAGGASPDCAFGVLNQISPIPRYEQGGEQ